MKKTGWLFIPVCFLLVLLFSAGILGRDEISTMTLPVTAYTEVRKDLIRAEGNAHPGGWVEYYALYKAHTSHGLAGRRAEPFDMVVAAPMTLEAWWVEILADQEAYLEDYEWAEEEYYLAHIFYSDTMSFQMFLQSDSLDRLAREYLRFIYQDSTGAQRDGKIDFYEIIEPMKMTYTVQVWINVPLGENPEEITWFSLHILNTQHAGSADMKWEFLKR